MQWATMEGVIPHSRNSTGMEVWQAMDTMEERGSSRSASLHGSWWAAMVIPSASTTSASTAHSSTSSGGRMWCATMEGRRPVSRKSTGREVWAAMEVRGDQVSQAGSMVDTWWQTRLTSSSSSAGSSTTSSISSASRSRTSSSSGLFGRC